MVEAEPEKHWFALEANPDVFNSFAKKIGFLTDLYSFVDVFSLDADFWQNMITSPVQAVVFCYKIRKQHKELIDE